jgi:hypothetical protein
VYYPPPPRRIMSSPQVTRAKEAARSIAARMEATRVGGGLRAASEAALQVRRRASARLGAASVMASEAAHAQAELIRARMLAQKKAGYASLERVDAATLAAVAQLKTTIDESVERRIELAVESGYMSDGAAGASGSNNSSRRSSDIGANSSPPPSPLFSGAAAVVGKGGGGGGGGGAVAGVRDPYYLDKCYRPRYRGWLMGTLLVHGCLQCCSVREAGGWCSGVLSHPFVLSQAADPPPSSVLSPRCRQAQPDLPVDGDPNHVPLVCHPSPPPPHLHPAAVNS